MWTYAVQTAQCPCHFLKANAEYLGELNLTYCLIYLDNVIVFSKTEEEHLKHLCVVFDCFWEHNLRLKPTKCNFFLDEINYLAHHVSKEGVQPSKENLKVIAEFVPPWIYTEIQASLGLVGHSRQFVKMFACIVQPLHKHLMGEAFCEKSKWVTLMVEAKDAFEIPKKACLEAPVLAFADFDKPFLWETNASKLGLGVVLSQSRLMADTIWQHMQAIL